jgi:CrcB protein
VARFLLICAGGAFGTGARYLLSTWMARVTGSGFPFGTLLVNFTGSFLLALLMEASFSTARIGADTRLILASGVLGGFTTYSTFNHETFALLRAGSWSLAAANAAATLLGCLAAAAIGMAAARAMTG